MRCPALNITFLGTGTSGGVPIIGCHCEVCSSADPKDNRLRSSILVRSATTTLVVDTGPDFRQQMLRIDNEKLDAVLFTHPHKDHIAGLDDIRAYNFLQQQPMKIFANTMTQEALKRDFYYAFEENKFPGIPQLDLIAIDREPFMVGDIPVQPFYLWHYKMPVLGFRFGDFAYATDVNNIDDDQKEIIKGTKVLILDALGKVKHISHYSLDEALEVADELQVPQVYFTHIGHKMGLHRRTNAELPLGRELAYDGLQIDIPAVG